MSTLSGRSTGIALLALLAAGVLSATSCALFGPRYFLAEDAPEGGDVKRLVLLPMNYDYSPTPEVAVGTEQMGGRLRSFLESSGYEVVVARMSNTLAVWRECTASVGGIAKEGGKALDEDRYEMARSELARRTLERTPADAVMTGTVMLREGRYVGKKLRWDGVLREVPMDMGETNIPLAFVQGNDFGTSLRTSIFDSRGRKIFERYVGLEPIRAYRANAAGTGMEIFKRLDLFQDEALLEEGVAVSFEPWLVRPPARAE